MYRAKPVTQRDGSKLQNSNCRMASISTGLDFDTLGKKTSTGGKMRTYTSDQSGGTDSGDAKEAWSKGYKEVLTVRDGNTWAQAVADLRAGRLINLDVWHEATQGPCLSGGGRYGHNMAVAPEKNGTRWLVSDPWCKPAKWQWWEEDLLRVGAEEWGRRLRNGTAGREHFTSDTLYRLALAETARRLMGQYFPGNEAPPNHLGVTGPDGEATETGGPSTIMYTMTAAHPDGGGGGGGGVPVAGSRFVSGGGYGDGSAKLINASAGSPWYYFDGVQGGTLGGSGVINLTCFGLLDGRTDQFVVKIKTGVPYSDKVARDTLVLIKTTNDPYDKPVTPPTIPPPTPGDGDCASEVTKAVAKRDQEWEDWLLGGAPNQHVEGT